MTQAISPAPPPAPVDPTHPCLRCGTTVSVEVALCDECNPLGLAQPASTQVHAIAAGGIVLFVVFLAAMASIAMSGIGPFAGRVDGTARDGGGLRVSVSVTNEGSREAHAACTIVDPDRRTDGPSIQIQTPAIPPGGTVVVNRTLAAFGSEPLTLDVACLAP